MNNSIEHDTILDEQKAGEFEYVSLSDRLRWVDQLREDATACDSVFEEAAQALTEVRDILLAKGIDSMGVTAGLIAYDLLTNLSVQHTHRISATEFVQLDLIQMLAGKVAREKGLVLERGYLAAAGYLEEAAIVLDALRPDARAELLLKRITDRSRVSRVSSREREYSLTCDGTRHGHPCWMKSPLGPSDELASAFAKHQGWLVSSEKDLCPECWAEADPDAAALASPQPDGPPPTLTPEGLIRSVAMLVEPLLRSGKTPTEVFRVMREQFGEDQMRDLADELLSDEALFELLHKSQPPIDVPEQAFRALLALIRPLASTDVPDPPLPAGPE